MLVPIKTLKTVSDEIHEQLGVEKKLIPQNGYYFSPFGSREIIVEDNKVQATMTFKSQKNNLSLGHFKSKRGYNSKLKNTKEHANHYAEYIAYLILEQLGKEACKVDLGEINVKNKYSKKIVNIEGVLSYYELTQEENLKTFEEIIESYKKEHPRKYREMAIRGRTNSDTNYANIEIILKTLEEFCTKNEQAYKIPKMKKHLFGMCIFDLIFANRDRHEQNFGLKVNQLTNDIDFYPLFDNEQILGLQEEKENIKKYLTDEKAYEEFKRDELTSFIGIPGETQKTSPTKFLNYLLENYCDETMESLRDIGRYQISDLQEVLEICPELSKEHKELAKKIFLERQKEIADTVKAFEKTKLKKQTKDDDKSLEL